MYNQWSGKQTLTCVFVTKRPSNNLWSPSVQRDSLQQYKFIRLCILPHERKNRTWQPVSCVLSLEWSHPPPAPSIRARRPEVLRVPYSQKDAHSLQVKKDKLLRKDSKCLHMYFKPSMKNNPFQKKKNRYKSGFSVCFSWKAELMFVHLLVEHPSTHPHPNSHPTTKSKFVTAQSFFNLFIFISY